MATSPLKEENPAIRDGIFGKLENDRIGVSDSAPVVEGNLSSLDAYQLSYLERIEGALVRHSRWARRFRRRFWTLSLLSIATAGSIPVVIAAGLPAWIAAVLGALTATTQGVEQLLQDQKRSIETHTVAVNLTRLSRTLRYNLGKTTDSSTRSELFDEFFAESESILEVGSNRILAALGSSRSDPKARNGAG